MNTAPSTGDLSQDLPSYLRPPFNKVRGIDHLFAYLLASNFISARGPNSRRLTM
jgi:hypothetical protein